MVAASSVTGTRSIKRASASSGWQSSPKRGRGFEPGLCSSNWSNCRHCAGAKQELLRASKQHPDYKLLLSQPGFGPVRVAILLAQVGSPHRFRTKRQCWPYCGLAVVTYSSADHQIVNGVITKRRKVFATRGLNPHHVPALKSVFKDAALSARRQEPFKSWYQERIAKGQRPEMVRWSLARKLAATTLIIWQRGEKFDGQKVSATLRGE